MHRTLRNTLFSCAAAASTGLFCLADAQEVAEGGITALRGLGEGPRGEDKSDFDNLLRNPNATGSSPVAGPYFLSTPTSSNVSRWSWSISVVADLPTPDGDEFYTGGNLVFNGPSSAANASSSSADLVEDGWSVCLYEWTLWGAAYPASLREDNGTCSSVLSTECIAAMEREAASKHTSTNCRCPTAKDIPECAELGDDSALWSTGCGANYYNSSAVRAWGDDGLEKFTFGGPASHERGNITAYNYIGSIAWPVMASFSDVENGGLVTAKLSCPRAGTATEGSVAPNDDGLDAGDGQDQDEGDDQSDQQGGGGRNNANWVVLGVLLTVAVFTV